jgi:TlyA family rRNA methyltransferase/putative hemolysin
MKRLDVALVERGLCESREKAKRAIMAGMVRVNDHPAHKASDSIKDSDALALVEGEKYVSRGGLKLEHALRAFQVNVTHVHAADLGASTGGFTDCLLQHGAERVYAVDVGHGQLAWRLRRDPRVVVMEKTNARYVTPASFPPPFRPVDLAVIDCSFISLRKILPPAVALVKGSGKIIALVKPQFEAGKAEADKGAGVIRDPAIHERVIRELRAFVAGQPELTWSAETESPLAGPAGNKEFLVLIEKTGNRRIGLIANSEKSSCRKLVREAAELIRDSRRDVLTDTATGRLADLDVPTYPDAAAVSKEADLLMIFGGDGTMLRVAREIAGSRTPMLGINAGGLGFLTDVQAHQLPLALEELWSGQTVLEKRPLIEAMNETWSDRALNDFVITRGCSPRLIELEVAVDGEMLTVYRCDGLIVCSPTGSTAYSLAAGGAVVAPAAEVFTLTPICPHTLSNRSVIVSLDSIVTVRVLSRHVETILTADGQQPRPLAEGDMITIRRSKHEISLLHLAGSSFFETLRRKLGWSGSHVKR